MALVRKDLRLELRTRETIVAMVLFAIVMLAILQFGFGTRDDDLTRFVGGLMWVTLAFTAVLGVGRSYVAEREQRLAAQREVQAKSQFLSNMSHEIRTPLNAITGMAYLVRRSGVTAEQVDRLEKIDAAGRHLLAHELAHVVQQRGVEREDGAFLAAVLGGAGGEH